MSASNRAALINKLYKVLKKHYKPTKPPADRSLLEHMLYACALENATFEAADEAFAKLQQSFFDWNEIRVTTVAELAEVMSALPDPGAAASRLKRCLQSVFEAHYAFEIELLKKQNLGKAIELLEKINGTTPFVVAYVSQHGLGGHCIPTSQGVLDALEVVGLITEVDAKKNHVPGMERTIPKVKGIEFASLLHQLGTDYFASPWGTRLRAILVEIEPEAKDRLPKRSQKPERTPPHSGTAARGAAAPAHGSAAPTRPEASSEESTISSNKKRRVGRPPKSEVSEPAARAEAEDKSSKDESGERRSPTKQLARKKPR